MTNPSPQYLPKEKRWKIRIVYLDDTGRHEKVFSSSKQGDAGKREVIAKYRAWRGNTFSVIWNKYIQDKAYRLGKDNKAVGYAKSVANLYLLPAFGDKSIDGLKIQDYQDFINTLTLLDGTAPSSKYLHNIIDIIHNFLKWSYECEYLYEPLRGKLYLPKERTSKEKIVPTLAEFYKLCEPMDYWYQPLIIFLCCTGLRPSEAIGLKEEDIIDGVAYIKRGILTNGQISTGKTKSAQRAVPLCNLAMEQVRIMRSKYPDSEYIFCNTEGKTVGQGRVYKQLQRICQKCGIREFPLYSCRHFFITYTADVLGMSALRHAVGHTESMDTLGVYSHSTTDELQAIKTNLDDIFKLTDKDE